MATAYAPGLTVTASTRHRVRRLLPINGNVLVHEGQAVHARDVVAQTFMPGDVLPLNMARLLGVPPSEVPGCMLKTVGQRITCGELLARTRGIFGMFRQELTSTVEGTIEAVSAVTGQVIVRGEPQPLQIRAYLTGTVVEIVPGEGCVVEAQATLVQGIFGVGGEASGPLRLVCRRHDQDLTDDLIGPSAQGAVLVGGARMTARAIARAREVGAAAIVSGGMDDQDLRELLGYDLGVAVTGSEQLGITVIITEGFGDIAMAERTFRLLQQRDGEETAVNGTTQIRAGVMRPEIVIPLGRGADATQAGPPRAPGVLDVGRPVRIIRDPHFGLIGSVAALPPELQVLPSGSRARALDVRIATGEVLRVPRANVELIEE